MRQGILINETQIFSYLESSKDRSDTRKDFLRFTSIHCGQQFKEYGMNPFHMPHLTPHIKDVRTQFSDIVCQDIAIPLKVSFQVNQKFLDILNISTLSSTIQDSIEETLTL